MTDKKDVKQQNLDNEAAVLTEEQLEDVSGGIILSGLIGASSKSGILEI